MCRWQNLLKRDTLVQPFKIVRWKRSVLLWACGGWVQQKHWWSCTLKRPFVCSWVFFVLAATNSWIKYRSDHQVFRRPENKRLHYCGFDLLLVKEMNALVQGGHCQQVDKVATNNEEYILRKGGKAVKPQLNNTVKDTGCSDCQWWCRQSSHHIAREKDANARTFVKVVKFDVFFVCFKDNKLLPVIPCMICSSCCVWGHLSTRL